MLRGILIFAAGVVVGAAGGGGYGYKLLQEAGDEVAKIAASRDAARSDADNAKKQTGVLEQAKAAAEKALSDAQKKITEAIDAHKAADAQAAKLKADLEAANKAKSELEAQMALTRSAPQPAPAPAQ